MRHNLFEILLGAFVLSTAIFIASYAFIYNSDKGINHYSLTAKFGRIDGIIPGAEVKLGGVKIGKVTKTYLDKQDFTSVLLLEIDGTVKLPKDSAASIASEGLLGKNFVRIEIPKSATSNNALLDDGGRIAKTTDPASLEDLLGRALFLIGGETE